MEKPKNLLLDPDIVFPGLCLHVVVVVGLVCVSDLRGYAVERLMPDRLIVRLQTKRDTRVYAVRGRGSVPGRVCSSDVSVQANQRRRNSAS